MHSEKILTATSQSHIVKVNGFSVVRAYLAGTFTGGSVLFTASVDSTDGSNGTWFAISGIDSVSGSKRSSYLVQSSPITSSVIFNTSGYAYIKAACSALATGSISINTELTDGSLESGSESGGNTAVEIKLLTYTAIAGTNIAVLKNSPVKIYGIYYSNASAASKFPKFYNKSSNPVLATDIPIITASVGASSAGSLLTLPAVGVPLSGLSIAITGATGFTDTTAIAAGDVILNIAYSDI